MARRDESLPYMLVHDFPWWVNVVLASGVYGLMRFVAPTLWQDNPVLGLIMKAMPANAWLGAMVFLCFAALSLWVRFLKRMQAAARKR